MSTQLAGGRATSVQGQLEPTKNELRHAFHARHHADLGEFRSLTRLCVIEPIAECATGGRGGVVVDR